MTRNLPLSLVLAAQSILQTLIVVGVVGATTYQSSKLMLRELGEQIGQEVSNEVALYLQHHFVVPHHLNRFNAQLITDGSLDPQNRAALEQYLLRQVQEFPVNRVSWSTPEGGLVSAGRDERGLTLAGTESLQAGPLRVHQVNPKGQRQNLLVERSSYDSRDRPFYEAAIQAGKPTWTPIYVYVPSSEGLGLSASYPLYGPEDQLLGVLSSDIHLQDFDRFLDEFQVSQQGMVFIMERSGLLVASSDRQEALIEAPTPNNGSPQRIFATASQNPVVRAAAKQILVHFQDIATINHGTQLWIPLQDEEYLVSLELLQDPWGLDWFSVVLVPQSDLIAPLYQSYRRIALLCGFFLLLIAASSIWFSRRITRSFTDIIHLTQTYALQESSTPFPQFTHSRIRETQTLSQVFQKFLATLSQHQALQREKEKKLAENLDQQTETLTLAQQIAHIGSWKFDIATETLVWSEELYRLFGADPHHPVPRPDRSIQSIHPDDQALYQEIVLRRFQQYQSFEGEFRIITQKGEIRYVQMKGQPFYNANGAVTKFVGTMLDITDRKSMELALKQSEQRLKEIADALPARISYTDAQQRYRFVNRASEIWLDRPRSDIQGRTVAEIFGPEDYAKVKPYIERALRGETVTYELEIAYGGWRPRHVSGVLVPDFNPQGEVQGYYSLVTDISTLKQTQQALLRAKEEAEQAARLKVDFLARMSHDIRTPMNGVLGLLTLLQQGRLDSLQHTQLRLAQSSAKSLLHLIDDVLDFSKIEANKLELESLPFNLYDCFGDLAQTLAIQAENKGLVLVLDLHQVEYPWVKGDEGRLKQIFNNLLSNALKFTRSGEIILRVQVRTPVPPSATLGTTPDPTLPPTPQTPNPPPSGPLELKGWVQDTGLGIPIDQQEQIFEAFSQVGTHITREFGGTGLGLAIVKHLCELMGGSVSVTSEIGQGSCFCCTVLLESCGPAEVTRLPHSTLDLPAQPNLKGCTILVVDGHARRRSALCQQLEAWGARTKAAANGQSARLLCAPAHFAPARPPLPGPPKPPHLDAILVQQTLPDTTGLHLIQDLQTTIDLPANAWILLTSLQNPQLQDSAIPDPPPSQAHTSLALPTTPPQLWHTLPGLFSTPPPEPAPPLTSAASPAPATLPTAAIPPETPSNPQPNPIEILPWPGETRILLVEDHTVNRIVAEGMLRTLGLTAVDWVEGGQAALDRLAETVDWPYTLVLLDCQMPQMDGYTTAEQIREGAGGLHNQNIVIIAMTANAMAGDRERCLAAGMDDYVAKPIELAALKQVLAQWLLRSPLDRQSIADPTPSADPTPWPQAEIPRLANSPSPPPDPTAPDPATGNRSSANGSSDAEISNPAISNPAISNPAISNPEASGVQTLGTPTSGTQTIAEVRPWGSADTGSNATERATTERNATGRNATENTATGRTATEYTATGRNAIDNSTAERTLAPPSSLPRLPTPPSPPLTLPVFNAELMLRRLGNRIALAQEACRGFLEFTPTHLQELHDSVAQQNLDRISIKVHALRGTAAMVGGQHLAAMLQTLESQVQQPGWDPTQAQTTLAEIEQAYRLLKAALEEWLARSQGEAN